MKILTLISLILLTSCSTTKASEKTKCEIGIDDSDTAYCCPVGYKIQLTDLGTWGCFKTTVIEALPVKLKLHESEAEKRIKDSKEELKLSKENAS